MESVVLTSGVRTAVGTFGGALSETPASDLAAHVFRQAVQRAGIHGEQVDQVVLGCVGFLLSHERPFLFGGIDDTRG